MPHFTPTHPPFGGAPDEVARWVYEELSRLSGLLEQNQTDAIELESLAAEPTRLFEGMTVNADGTNWDPGSGQGLYAYINGAWVFLGAQGGGGGGGSGVTLNVLPAGANHPPGTAPATFDTRGDILLLEFDAGADEEARLLGFMPRGYSNGGLTCTIVWASDTETSGNVRWELAFKSLSDDADDLDSKAFAAGNGVTAAAPDVSGEFKYTEVTFTDGADMDSVAAGEFYFLSVKRLGTDAADTMVGDAQLLAVEIQET